MQTRYAIVRYLPNALNEEFINIGVVVLDDGRVRARFIEDWTRVEKLAGYKVERFAEHDVVVGGMGRLSARSRITTPYRYGWPTPD